MKKAIKELATEDKIKKLEEKGTVENLLVVHAYMEMKTANIKQK